MRTCLADDWFFVGGHDMHLGKVWIDSPTPNLGKRPIENRDGVLKLSTQ